MAFIWAHLRFRAGRVAATLAAVAIAVGSFALLGSAARGAQLQAQGTVRANFRPVYDLLVRPVPEGGDPRVSFDAAMHGDGGITVAQWRKVQAVPGVEVAAPLATVGYVQQVAAVPIDLTPFVDGRLRRQVLRVRPTWEWDGGLSHAGDAGSYLYITTDRLDFVPGDRIEYWRQYGGSDMPRSSRLEEVGDDGRRVTVCAPGRASSACWPASAGRAGGCSGWSWASRRRS
ncbi:MAG TPA: hypothetical protein VL738_26650, partial [Dactylosporangium sp.]|nr:hypothetical protein [Dactylosporangium sp.]